MYCICHYSHHWHEQTQIGRAAGWKETQLLTGKSFGYVCLVLLVVCVPLPVLHLPDRDFSGFTILAEG